MKSLSFMMIILGVDAAVVLLFPAEIPTWSRVLGIVSLNFAILGWWLLREPKS